MTTDQHAEKAKQLMRHYFSLAVQGSGQRWDSDNAGAGHRAGCQRRAAIRADRQGAL